MNAKFLSRELNPYYDISRHNQDSSFKGDMQDFGWYCINAPKHAVRGGAIGSILGSTIGFGFSLFTGGETIEGAKYGAESGLIFGMTLDFLQYLFRFTDHLLRKKITSNVFGRACFWTVAGGLSALMTYTDYQYENQLKKVNNSFIKTADTNLDGKVDVIELELVNKKLKQYFTNDFEPVKNVSQLSTINKIDYLKLQGLNPEAGYIYLIEKNKNR